MLKTVFMILTLLAVLTPCSPSNSRYNYTFNYRDISLTYFDTIKSVLFYVCRNGTVCANTEISIFTSDNIPTAKGTTDKNGILVIKNSGYEELLLKIGKEPVLYKIKLNGIADSGQTFLSAYRIDGTITGTIYPPVKGRAAYKISDSTQSYQGTIDINQNGYFTIKNPSENNGELTVTIDKNLSLKTPIYNLVPEDTKPDRRIKTVYKYSNNRLELDFSAFTGISDTIFYTIKTGDRLLTDGVSSGGKCITIPDIPETADIQCEIELIYKNGKSSIEKIEIVNNNIETGYVKYGKPELLTGNEIYTGTTIKGALLLRFNENILSYEKRDISSGQLPPARPDIKSNVPYYQTILINPAQQGAIIYKAGCGTDSPAATPIFDSFLANVNLDKNLEILDRNISLKGEIIENKDSPGLLRIPAETATDFKINLFLSASPIVYKLNTIFDQRNEFSYFERALLAMLYERLIKNPGTDIIPHYMCDFVKVDGVQRFKNGNIEIDSTVLFNYVISNLFVNGKSDLKIENFDVSDSSPFRRLLSAARSDSDSPVIEENITYCGVSFDSAEKSDLKELLSGKIDYNKNHKNIILNIIDLVNLIKSKEAHKSSEKISATVKMGESEIICDKINSSRIELLEMVINKNAYLYENGRDIKYILSKNGNGKLYYNMNTYYGTDKTSNNPDVSVEMKDMFQTFNPGTKDLSLERGKEYYIYLTIAPSNLKKELLLEISEEGIFENADLIGDSGLSGKTKIGKNKFLLKTLSGEDIKIKLKLEAAHPGKFRSNLIKISEPVYDRSYFYSPNCMIIIN